MNELNRHIKNSEAENQPFFARGEFAWAQSKESIWEEKFAQLDEKQGKSISIARRLSYGIAASLILLVGLGFTAWFYTKTIETDAGEHFTAQLPDGSSVEMNAQSTLKYYPCRWYVSRDLVFKGEGFFEVEKGKMFTVQSDLGKTVVLGTSFNIYSRNDYYKVACVSGKVQVSSTHKESVVLNPDQQVVIKKGYDLIKTEVVESEELLMWRNNRFLFKATPIKDVAEEIGRQYGIEVHTDKNISGSFTGSFSRQTNVENVLKLVCEPLEFKFIKQNENSYLIVRKE